MRLFAMPSLRDVSACIDRERVLYARTPKADRAIIAGIEHVRVLREGEWRMVPVCEVRHLGLGRRDRAAVSVGAAL